MKLPEESLRVGVAISLENNSGEGILDTLEFVCDIVRCTEENRVSIVKA